MEEQLLISVFKIKPAFLQVWCPKTQSNLAIKLAQTNYLGSDAGRIAQTHKDRWPSYVGKLQLSFCTRCWSQGIYYITIAFSSCDKVRLAYALLQKACVLWNSQQMSKRQPYSREGQNRRQKVFSGEALRFCRGALRLCEGAWHSKNWQKLHWFIVFHFSIRGSLELCLGG